MRRGTGIADLIMYLLLFFLVSIALLVTTLSPDSGVTITIESDSSRMRIADSVAARSIGESTLLTRFAVQDAFGVDFRRHDLAESERFVAYASEPQPVKMSGSESGSENGAQIDLDPVFSIWRAPKDDAPLTAVFRNGIEPHGLQWESNDQAVFAAGIDAERPRSTRTILSTPAFKGSDPVFGSIAVDHDVPVGVQWDAR